MAAKVTYDEMQKATIAFWSGLVGSLVVAFGIHIFAPTLDRDPIVTPGLVLLFFGCLASATWSLTTPFAEFLAARMRWKFSNSGPAINHMVERYVIRLSRYVTTIGNVATIGVGFIGVGVLSNWPLFDVLSGYGSTLIWIGFCCLLALPIVALSGIRQLREAMVLKHQIDDEAAAMGISTRTAATEAAERKAEEGPSVKITGPMTFTAGGYDWNVGDFYKNTAIFGQTGSGKTICVLNALLDGMLGATGAAKLPAAALILDPKGDFRDKIEALSRAHGRKDDLVIIDPDDLERSISWNPLDSEDDALELAGRFGAVMEILDASGQDDAFWINSTKRLVENLISLLRYARPNTPPDLVEVYQAAMSDQKIEDYGRLVSEDVFEASPDVKRTFDYFFDVWLPMPADTRATIRGFVTNMLGSFLKEPFDTLFSGKSSTTIAQVLDEGKILYVHMPIAEREVMARVVTTFVKLEFYREVLRRPRKKRPSFLLCDEFQSFFTVGQGKGDADAFERTRESNHANIVAFQNLNALFKQTDRKEPVLNLLGNCAIKLFLRNTEKETNEYASDLFGEHIETLSSTSVGVAGGRRGARGDGTVSGNAQYSARVKKDAFSGLAVPSREEGKKWAEVIGHLASRSTVETPRMSWKVHPIGKR